MTKVRFTFFDIEGNPLQNMEFTLLLQRASFNEEDTGVVLPETLVVTTDENGQAIVELWPLKAPYKIRIAPEFEDMCGKMNWSFYVPISDVIVDAQHLFLVPPPTNLPWDEEAIGKINQAVIDSKNSADASEASAVRAETAADAAELAIDTVAEFARQAKLSEEAAALSATSAGDSATAAGLSEAAAQQSEEASHANQLAAAQAAEASAASAGTATEQATIATTQAGLAKGSADAAELSSSSAQESAGLAAADVLLTHADVVTTTTNKQATAADVVAVTTLKGEVSDLKDETEVYRDEALAAVGTITGVLVDGGLVDLSGSAYPPKPAASTIWRVTVGGTVTTVPEGTITYGVGDSLVYTKTQDIWYKIDNQNAVTSVNTKTGAVVLVAADVGLGNVNNTSDMDKPVSNAQQTLFNARTPTSTNLDKTAGRLTKVGDYGENGGPPIARIATDDANNLTVSATYAFTDGGVNVPEAAYVKHIGHGTVGYSKQLAYGILTDKQYVRTQVNGVWSNWTSAVEIIDALTSTDPTKALSAKQGKVLYDLLLANNATIVRYSYSLASGVTVVSGADITGKTLSYVPGTPMIVDKDGFAIQLTKDYTASNGTSLVLAVPTEQACEITITVFGAFTVADHYTKSETDVLLKQNQTHVLSVAWESSRSIIPNGFVPADGGTYSRATYPDAWAAIQAGLVPVVTDAAWLSTPTNRASYTAGDGSTTFRVPDLNGKAAGSLGAVFQRGDGALSAATAGIIQPDAFQQHQHTIPFTGQGVTNGYQSYKLTNNDIESNGATSVATTGRFASETRPLNATGVWVIKLFGTVSNPGAVDAATLAGNLAALDNAAYKKTNVVGVVGQVAGVPTGAIIERGSNANGEFIKYADGTLICWRNDTATVAMTSAYGSVFNGPSFASVNYPHAFTSMPVVTQTVSGSSGVTWLASNGTSSTTQWVGMFPLSAVSQASVSLTIHRMAIGRWY